MEFSNSVLIRRPPRDVFAFLANPENIPRWNYAITSTRQLTAGPFGAGTRFQQTRSLPRPATEELEVVEFVPDRRPALRGTLGPFAGTLVYVIEAVREGTRVTNAVALTGRGVLRFVEPLAAGRVREAVAANLEKLRELVESSA